MGRAAGNTGDQALSVWLDGVSLSGAEGLPRLNAQQLKLSLANLSVACMELYATSGDKNFLHARAASSQLRLQIPEIERDARTSGYFCNHQAETEAMGIEAMSVDATVQAIEETVLRAFELSDDAEELADEGVSRREEIYFKSFRDFPRRRG